MPTFAVPPLFAESSVTRETRLNKRERP